MKTLRILAVVIVLMAVAACDVDEPHAAGSMESIPLPVEMIVVGDFGDGGEEERRVAATMKETTADLDISLLVTTGDNFYSDDLTEVWNRPYSWVDTRSIEIAAAWGNHDVVSETRRNLVQEALDPPARWYSAPLGVEGRLIVLDSTQVDSTGQAEWFESELEEAGSPTVVVFHHPAYSCGSHGNEGSVHEHWLPLMEDDDVDLVLNGHDHNYQRFEIEGATYVVTGGGGRSLTGLGDCSDDTPSPVVSDDSNHHFLVMEVTETAISIEAIAASGMTIDSFDIDLSDQDT